MSERPAEAPPVATAQRHPPPKGRDGTAWAAAFRYAVRDLRLSPEAFWRLSVAEWRMLTGAEAPLRRGELSALMARFPDEDKGR